MWLTGLRLTIILFKFYSCRQYTGVADNFVIECTYTKQASVKYTLNNFKFISKKMSADFLSGYVHLLRCKSLTFTKIFAKV